MTFESEGLLIVAIYIWLPLASYVVFLTTLVYVYRDITTALISIQVKILCSYVNYKVKLHFCEFFCLSPLIYKNYFTLGLGPEFWSQNAPSNFPDQYEYIIEILFSQFILSCSIILRWENIGEDLIFNAYITFQIINRKCKNNNIVEIL